MDLATMSTSLAGLGSSRAAFEAAAAAQRLNLLDDLWTGYAQLRDPSDEEDLEQNQMALTDLVRDMQELLGDIRTRAGELRELIAELGDDAIDQAMGEMIEKAPIGEALRAELGIQPGDRGFAVAVSTACEYVRDHALEESEELQEGLDAVLRREVAGDFKLPFKCSLLLIGAGGVVVGGALLGAVAGIAVGAVALGVAGGTVSGAGTALIAFATSPCADRRGPRTA
jgi:hypothetical protein